MSCASGHSGSIHDCNRYLYWFIFSRSVAPPGTFHGQYQPFYIDAHPTIVFFLSTTNAVSTKRQSIWQHDSWNQIFLKCLVNTSLVSPQTISSNFAGPNSTGWFNKLHKLPLCQQSRLGTTHNVVLILEWMRFWLKLPHRAGIHWMPNWHWLIQAKVLRWNKNFCHVWIPNSYHISDIPKSINKDW